MPHPLLTVSMVSAALLAAGSARAADMRLEPPAAYTPPPVAYAPPPVAYAPPPVVVVSPPVVVLPPPVAVVPPRVPCWRLGWGHRSEEHTSELQSHSFISYAVFCLKKKK